MTVGTRNASATSGLADVEIQLASDDLRCPPSQRLVEWVHAVLGPRPDSQLTLRIVGDAESAELNQRYRSRAGATNVLSFGAAKDWPAIEGEPMPVGDLVVCAPVLEREAAEQGKTLEAHWAHIVVHGVLHLLGYDHEADDDALAMEAEERRLLARLGFPDPYADDEEHAR